MLTPEQIEKLINLLPMIFMYFMPGYVFLWAYNFQLSKSLNKSKHVLVKCALFSYVILSIAGKLTDNILESNWIKILIIVASSFAGIIIAKLLKCNKIEKILNLIGIYNSFHTRIWSKRIDFDHGNWAKVYLNDEKIMYFGIFKDYEIADDEDYFISMKCYRSYDYSNGIDNKIVIEDNKDDNTKWVLINTKNINRIELIYNPLSQKINN